LDGRLRLLLLNNGCGGIFSRLPGLEASPAASTVISGAHHATAQGICAQWGIGYQQAHDMTSAKQGIDALLSDGQERPMLLEVFTTTQQDNAALQLG
jgi:2-succinyl-5-enolpyruvyl-6-hydroxy-3-cyclohexene-1-carboxylate synthase